MPPASREVDYVSFDSVVTRNNPATTLLYNSTPVDTYHHVRYGQRGPGCCI